MHACVVTSASHGEQWVVLCFVSRLASLVVGFVARRSIVAQHSKVEYHTHCVMVTHWWDVSGRLASLILTLTHTQSHNLLCSYKHCCLQQICERVCVLVRHVTTVRHFGSSVPPLLGPLEPNGKGSFKFSTGCSAQHPVRSCHHVVLFLSFVPLLLSSHA